MIYNRDRLPRRDHLREQIAHLAARLMAEAGITDYAFAKRKAARQMGVNDTHSLPSNEEVDVALRSFRNLYQSDSHPDILRRLRREALEAMQLLEPFHPYLTGSVLNGTAGEQSDINLRIFSDNEKEVMMFLLKHNLPFESGEWRTRVNGREQTVPSFTLQSGSGSPIHLAVLPENSRRSGDFKPESCADIASVKELAEEIQ